MLKKLDRLCLTNIFLDNWLTKFYLGQKLCVNQILDLIGKVISTFKNFLANNRDNHKVLDIIDGILNFWSFISFIGLCENWN